MKKTIDQLNKDRAAWNEYSKTTVRNYLIANLDLHNQFIITKEGYQLYLKKRNLIKYIVKTDKQFMKMWEKFHKKASKKLASDDSIQSKIISGLYKKITEQKLWVNKKHYKIFKNYTKKERIRFRIGEIDTSKRDQKKYKEYILDKYLNLPLPLTKK
jgi:endo-1,4-beta-D-glucanase Y